MRVAFEQLALPLVEPEAPTLENFVPVGNEEAVSALRKCRAGEGPQFLCLWGPAGSGRSHLLRSLTPCQTRRVPVFDEGTTLYTADNVEKLDAEDLENLFILMNEVRSHPGTRLVSATSRPPQQLTDLRVDVTSRLSWGLVFEIRPLPAKESLKEFIRRCRARGIDLRPEVIHWIETYCPRDMKNLVRLLNAIDAYALQQKRRVTVQLLQERLFDAGARLSKEVFQ